MSPIGMHPICE